MSTNMVFQAKINDQMRDFSVLSPTFHHQREAQKVYNKAFKDAVNSGALLRVKLDDFMEEQNIWNEEKQAKLKTLQNEIATAERKLQEGGFSFDEAVAMAKATRTKRVKLRELISQRTELDVHTAEGQADNARFNYYVSACTMFADNQKPAFSGLEDYLNKAGEEYSVKAAEKMAQLLYGLDDNYESRYGENQFLQEFGLVDKKNRFVNEDGDLVDEDGRLINEDGFYIMADKKTLCDRDGNPIDEEGNYIVERKPFLDKDGNPVQPKVAKVEVEEVAAVNEAVAE